MAPRVLSPHKALSDKRKRWSERRVFPRMMEGLASADAEPRTAIVSATCSKAHRGIEPAGYKEDFVRLIIGTKVGVNIEPRAVVM